MTDFFEKVEPEQLTDNFFSRIGKDWAILTAGDKSGFNGMTVSWGGTGILWNLPVAFVFVRPQRFTYGFTEKGDRFTLSFFPEGYRKALNLFGSRSGRDTDKFREAGLTAAEFPQGGMAAEEAELVLELQKLYFDDIKPENLLEAGISEKCYPNRDYHRMYLCQITGCWRRRG